MCVYLYIYIIYTQQHRLSSSPLHLLRDWKFVTCAFVLNMPSSCNRPHKIHTVWPSVHHFLHVFFHRVIISTNWWYSRTQRISLEYYLLIVFSTQPKIAWHTPLCNLLQCPSIFFPSKLNHYCIYTYIWAVRRVYTWVMGGERYLFSHHQV